MRETNIANFILFSHNINTDFDPKMPASQKLF